MADVTNDTPGEGEAEGRYAELAREFGRRLRTAREERYPRPRQEDWAREMGLKSVRQYQRWENGELLPSLERLPKILAVSGIDVTDLFDAPGSLTRDGIQEHFDMKIEELKSQVEANFYALAESLGEVRSIVEDLQARLPGKNGSL